MQIDQCLSCSRYEPIIGQTYDLISNNGAANLANIEDDMQMGYMNMDDYINFVRVEKMHDKKKEATLNYSTATKRDPNERDFKDQWGKGVVMSWKLTPVESQKPQINWRKDINSEDSSPAKLDSYQAGAGQANDVQGSTLQAGSEGEWMQKHYDVMQDILNKKPSSSSDSGSSSKKSIAKSKASPGKKRGTDDEEDRLIELQNIIKDGFGTGKQSAGDALEAMKNNGYEQALQNACSAAGMDPVLAFSIAAVETGGDPSRGLFGKGDNLNDGLKSGMEAMKSAKAHESGGNPIGFVQAFKGWNDSLEKLNSGSRTFDIEWTDACGDGNAKSYFPAVAQAYATIKAANTGLSQLRTDINGGTQGAEFPIATADLPKSYLVQDYGVSEKDGGVAAVSNCLVIKVPDGTSLHLPCDGSPSAMQYDDAIGNYVTLTDGSIGEMYIFGGLNYASGGSKKGDTFAYTTDKLILQMKNKDGYHDPKNIWQKLCNKASTEKSIGQFIEEENQHMSNTK